MSTVSIVCPVNDSTSLCETLSSTGAGVGVFIQYMGVALPTFLILIGVIGGVVAVIFAVAGLIKNSISKHNYK